MQPANDDQERLSRLRLIRSENIGPVNFVRLLDRYGSAADALAELPEIAARAGKRRLRIATQAEAERETEATMKAGARFIMIGDPDYPPLLAEIDTAPPVLAKSGDLSLLKRTTIAIVGARNASSNGRNLCRRVAAALGEHGVTVVSGLARGIDTEAHTASLATGTIGVIAGGIDVPYPPENAELQHRIGAEGLLLAEAPFGTQPRSRHFPRRNRIISGVSQGVAVIEAAMRSGSLITARQAGEQGRDVFAVPGSPLDPRTRGTNRLIRDGAQLIESAEDILDHIGPGGLAERPRIRPHREPVQVAPPEADDVAGRSAILEALSPEPADADDVIRTTGLTPAQFNGLVLELEIAGLVERHAGNRYALRAPE